MTTTPTLDIIAMSEDGDWLAFPISYTRRQVASELIYNMADWWMDEHEAVWIDDDDVMRGWITAFRDLLTRIERGWVRHEPLTDGTDWWRACDEGDKGAEPAWIVGLW